MLRSRISLSWNTLVIGASWSGAPHQWTLILYAWPLQLAVWRTAT